MANPLASTTFATGPKDALAALDVYNAKGTSIVNSIQALSEKADFDVSTLLGGKSSIDGALGSVLKLTKSGALDISTAALTARLLGTNSALKSSFATMTSDMRAGVVGSFSDLGSIQSTINGVQSSVDSFNFTGVSSLGTFMGEYTKQPTLFSVQDTDGMASLMGGLINEGSNLGVSNVFSTLTADITDNGLMNKIVNISVPTLMKNGDFTTIFDMSGTPISGTIKACFPDFASKLTLNYRDKLSGGARDDLNIFSSVMGSLRNIDGQWDQLTRQNGDDPALNLFSLMASSSDFQKLIVTGVKALTAPDDTQYYLLNGLYKKTTVDDEVKRCFPQTVMLTPKDKRNTKSQAVVDPRTLVKLAGLVGEIALG